MQKKKPQVKSFSPGINSEFPATTQDIHPKLVEVAYNGIRRQVDQSNSMVSQMLEVQHRHNNAVFELQQKKELAKLKLHAKVEAEQNQAYNNIMGYPGPGSIIEDQYGHVYRVDSVQESMLHKTFPNVTLRIMADVNVEQANAIDIIWVPDKLIMGRLYGNPTTWPDPTTPAVFCYVGNQDQVWVGHRSTDVHKEVLFKLVTNWQEYQEATAMLSRMVAYKQLVAENSKPAGPDPNYQEKFDIFLNALNIKN